MKVELTKVKYAAFASQETSCFQATVVIDDKVAGHVRNDGHGGANHYEPRSVEDALNAHAKTLPPLKARHEGERDLDMDADLFIGGLLTDHLLSEQMKRKLRSHVLYAEKGELWSLKPRKGEAVPIAAHRAAMAKDRQVLNLLPQPEALALFKQLGTKEA